MLLYNSRKKENLRGGGGGIYGWKAESGGLCEENDWLLLEPFSPTQQFLRTSCLCSNTLFVYTFSVPLSL